MKRRRALTNLPPYAVSRYIYRGKTEWEGDRLRDALRIVKGLNKMILPNESAEYYEGCRAAIYQYAIHRDGEMYVGCQIKTYQQAIDEVDRYDDASPYGRKVNLEAEELRKPPAAT